jgi:hypothetical protein
MSDSQQEAFQAVVEPCAAYKAMKPKWDMIEALLGGTEAMRSAGEKYLPRSPRESAMAYQTRRDQSFLFGGYKRILASLAGKPFRRAIALGPDVPALFTKLLENIDLRGSQLNVFAADVFHGLLRNGSVHILVDFPANTNAMTRLDEILYGARPYWSLIAAPDLLGWRHEFVNGKPKLVQARIMERVLEPKGDFGETEVEQVRVLQPGQFWVFRKDQNGDWGIYDNGDYSLDEIPLVTIKARGGNSLMTAEPPLLPVAEVNVAHWQSQSDQRNILHVVRCPILMGSGFNNDGDLEIGPNSLITAPDANAQLRYVEHNGAAIKSGQDDLDALEDKMAAMGLELLRAPSPMTATQAEIDNAGNEAELVTLAHLLQDGIENALGYTAMWLGGDFEQGGSVEVYKDFISEASRDTDIASLIQVRQLGDISRSTLLGELKRRGVFQDDFDPQQEMADVLDESAVQSQFDAQYGITPPQPGAVTPSPDQSSANDGGAQQQQQAA